jgi:hypothetical protein
MKYAVAALIATAAADKDALGCEGSNWGDWTAMRAESTCLFNKLHPDTAGNIQRGPIVHFVAAECVLKGWIPEKRACEGLAN